MESVADIGVSVVSFSELNNNKEVPVRLYLAGEIKEVMAILKEMAEAERQGARDVGSRGPEVPAKHR
mgnify:CR=1 FL=1